VPLDIGLLEDDQSQIELIELWLQAEGFICHSYLSGYGLLDALKVKDFHLLLIDWELPDINGLEVMQQVRNRMGLPVPIIFVTSRDSEQDIVAVLTAGADDYLIKPLRQQEFLARVKANMRRYSTKDSGEIRIEFPPYVFNRVNHQVEINGKVIDLSNKEFELAHYLFENEGSLLDRKKILAAVWKQQADITTRTVDTHVSTIRRKLAIQPQSGWRLKSIYGLGYRLERMAA